MNKDEYYRMFSVEEKLWWYRGLRDIVAYCLFTYAGSSSKILDAGCGTGGNMHYLQSLGYDVHGIDVSKDAIKLAGSRGIRNIEHGSITHLDVPDHTFDIVYMMDVIGLLDGTSVSSAIQECYRVLKPGGYLLLQCAALEWLRSQHDDVSHVVKRYTATDVEKLFTRKEWKIVKLSYRMFLLFMPLALIKFVKKINPFSVSIGDLYMPNPLLNRLLYVTQKIENAMFPYINFPIGTSLFTVVKKIGV